MASLEARLPEAQVKEFQSAMFAQPGGCSRFTPLTAENAGECTWNADARGRPVYQFGDSNAGHFVDAVRTAGDKLGRPVVVTTTNACSFLDVNLDRLDKPDSWDDMCRGYVQGTLDHLTTDAAPGTVVISNIDTYWGVAATPLAVRRRRWPRSHLPSSPP